MPSLVPAGFDPRKAHSWYELQPNEAIWTCLRRTDQTRLHGHASGARCDRVELHAAAKHGYLFFFFFCRSIKSNPNVLICGIRY